MAAGTTGPEPAAGAQDGNVPGAGAKVSGAPVSALPLTLWVVVLAGPAARAGLLGGLLVAEDAIGTAFGLGAGVLAVLFESVVFGSLVAVFLLPPAVRRLGFRRTSLIAAAATAACIGAGIVGAPHLAQGTAATVGLFALSALAGFFVAVLSPVAQTMLSAASEGNATRRDSLQSAWSAGQPIGFVAASFAGGLLIEQYGWWSALVVPFALALLCLAALCDRRIAHVDDKADTPTAAPLSEIAVIVLALLAFQIWSTWDSDRRWADPGVLVALAATIGLTALATYRLRTSSDPVISPAPFAVPGFAAAIVLLLIYQFPTTAEFEVLLLTELEHLTSAMIGDRTAIGNLAQVAGTCAAAALMVKGRYGLALAAGFGLTLVGLAGYVLYPWVHDFAYIVVTRSITGFGGGLVTPVLLVVAMSRMPAALHLAAGTWLVVAVIGGTEIGLALFDIVLDASTGVSGNRTGYLTVEVVQLVVGIATAALAAVLVARGRLLLNSGTGTRPPSTGHPL